MAGDSAALIAAAAASSVSESGAPAMAADQARQLLKALADPIRLDVVQALTQGERCVCELTEQLSLAQSRLSFHLRVMREAELIEAREQGRWVYYRLRPEAIEQLQGWLATIAASSRQPARPCCEPQKKRGVLPAPRDVVVRSLSSDSTEPCPLRQVP
jgi:ArsR family transcriptional regulator